MYTAFALVSTSTSNVLLNKLLHELGVTSSPVIALHMFLVMSLTMVLTPCQHIVWPSMDLSRQVVGLVLFD